MIKPLKGLIDDSAFIVVIVVIVGAFLLSGGQNIFQDNSEEVSSTPAATSGSAGGSAWSITYASKGCASTGEQIEITAKGPGTGYITVEVKNGSSFQAVDSAEFKSSPSIYSPVNLLKSAGFNTNPWRLKVWEGGSKTGGQWEGGTEKASTGEKPPSTCP